MLNKRGNELTLPVVLFIVLNILVFSLALAFIYKSSNSTLAYEEIYAKKLALIIDAAEYDSEFYLDVTDGVKAAQKNNVDLAYLKMNAFQLDEQKNQVIVKLGKQGGYSFDYLSDRKVKLDLNINNVGDAVLVIGVKNE